MLSTLSRSTYRPAQRTGVGRSPMERCAPCENVHVFRFSIDMYPLTEMCANANGGAGSTKYFDAVALVGMAVW
jgi:hypothetical protein